eukprot:4133348-Heterocapsa_arctica.AAC.1
MPAPDWGGLLQEATNMQTKDQLDEVTSFLFAEVRGGADHRQGPRRPVGFRGQGQGPFLCLEATTWSLHSGGQDQA